MEICNDCGIKYGTRLDMFSTMHTGVCQWCNKKKAVTEHRDYGYPEPPKKVSE